MMIKKNRCSLISVLVLSAVMMLTGCAQQIGTTELDEAESAYDIEEQFEQTEVSGEETAAEQPALPDETAETEQPVVPEQPQEDESGAQDTKSAADVQGYLESMTLEQKVYQMFIVTPEVLVDYENDPVTAAGDTTRRYLSERPVGGIIYFAKNLNDQAQTRIMISSAQQIAEDEGMPGLFIAVDEEGGLVARCADNLGTTAFNAMEYYGSRYMEDGIYEEVKNIGKTIGNDIGALGFNLDFAPVADVDLSPYNELGDRIFSSDPQITANMIEAEVKGFAETDTACTLKHFPGLGAESGNSHTETDIIIDRTLEQLEASEFIPFRRGIEAGAPFVMVGHQQMTYVGDGLPSDLSYEIVTNQLRNNLGFEGIAITDSHVMNTISEKYGSGGRSAVLAVKAGIDIVLMPGDLEEAANAVIQAVNNGEISENRIDESVTRILKQKAAQGLI